MKPKWYLLSASSSSVSNSRAASTKPDSLYTPEIARVLVSLALIEKVL